MNNTDLASLLSLLSSASQPTSAPAANAVPDTLPTNPPLPTETPKEKDETQNKELLSLIANQLAQFGLTNVSDLLVQSAHLTPEAIAPSNKLADLLAEAKPASAENDDEDAEMLDDNVDDSTRTRTKVVLESRDTTRPAHATPNYISWFATQHKGPVRGAAFNTDGSYFATCSADNSLKVLDVSKIQACHRDPTAATADKPAIRTFYDHQAPANDVAFHPNGTILVSCSDDMTIKLYDLQRPNVKRGFRYLQDACAVRCVSFHPTGDWLLAGTDHECVRIYDVQTFKCFRPSLPQGGAELAGSITKARFSPQGNVFATSSTDGTIRLYDGVGGKIINTIHQAHGGASVTSVEFSRNGKWLLSCGLDSLPRLWDLSSGRVVQTFEGASIR
ncbi:hypothetical protein HDU98_005963, partial [Podochytrium sp. JEL0797]